MNLIEKYDWWLLCVSLSNGKRKKQIDLSTYTNTLKLIWMVTAIKKSIYTHFQLNWSFLVYSYIKHLIKYPHIDFKFYGIMAAADVQINLLGIS